MFNNSPDNLTKSDLLSPIFSMYACLTNLHEKLEYTGLYSQLVDVHSYMALIASCHCHLKIINNSLDFLLSNISCFCSHTKIPSSPSREYKFC